MNEQEEWEVMSDLTVRGIKIENLEKQVAGLEAESARAWHDGQRVINHTDYPVPCPSCRKNVPGKEAHSARDCVDAVEAERDALYERRLPCREAEVAQKRYEDAEAENERAWGERDHYLGKLQERNTQLQQAEATIERLEYILNRIEMSGKEEMLAQYACDWAEGGTP